MSRLNYCKLIYTLKGIKTTYRINDNLFPYCGEMYIIMEKILDNIECSELYDVVKPKHVSYGSDSFMNIGLYKYSDYLIN